MIINFKLYEEVFSNNKIAEVIRSNGYIVSYYSRICLSTLKGKPELISATYESYDIIYGVQVLLDTYSFKKINTNESKTHPLSDFYYPIEMLEKLFYSDARVNYIKLDFFDELKELQKVYHNIQVKNKYNI